MNRCRQTKQKLGTMLLGNSKVCDEDAFLCSKIKFPTNIQGCQASMTKIAIGKPESSVEQNLYTCITTQI